MAENYKFNCINDEKKRYFHVGKIPLKVAGLYKNHQICKL